MGSVGRRILCTSVLASWLAAGCGGAVGLDSDPEDMADTTGGNNGGKTEGMTTTGATGKPSADTKDPEGTTSGSSGSTSGSGGTTSGSGGTTSGSSGSTSGSNGNEAPDDTSHLSRPPEGLEKPPGTGKLPDDLRPPI